MRDFINKNFKGDPIIWIVVLLLVIISAVEMYSASSMLTYGKSSYNSEAWRHIIFLGVGLCVIFSVHLIPYKYFPMIGVMIFPVAIVSLITLFILGRISDGDGNSIVIVKGLISGIKEGGALRWLNVAGIRFQPSELMKLSAVIIIAYILSRNQKEGESTDKAFKSVIWILAIACLLIIPENGSTSILLFIVGFTMMLFGRVSFKLLGKTLGVVALLLAVFLIVGSGKGWGRSDTGTNRITSFIEFKKEKLDSTFLSKMSKDEYRDKYGQMVQAKIAVANSNFIGRGPGNSVQRDFLSQSHSDFIYAIIIEELGMIGGFVVMMLYLILLFRAGVLANKCSSAFPAILVLGLTSVIVMQALVNMGVAVGLIPITGQPLPMISHGGTSIIVTSVYFGMILSVSRYVREESQLQAQKTEGSSTSGNDPLQSMTI